MKFRGLLLVLGCIVLVELFVLLPLRLGDVAVLGLQDLAVLGIMGDIWFMFLAVVGRARRAMRLLVGLLVFVLPFGFFGMSDSKRVFDLECERLVMSSFVSALSQSSMNFSKDSVVGSNP